MAIPVANYTKMTDDQIRAEYRQADDKLKAIGAADFRLKHPRNLRDWRDQMLSELERRLAARLAELETNRGRD
jgi:hypothetical protein